MSPIYTTSLPNYGASIVAGNQFSLPGDQKLGVVGALTYGRSFQRRAYRIENYVPSGADSDAPAVDRSDDITGVRGSDTVRWGCLRQRFTRDFARSSAELLGSAQPDRRK